MSFQPDFWDRLNIPTSTFEDEIENLLSNFSQNSGQIIELSPKDLKELNKYCHSLQRYNILTDILIHPIMMLCICAMLGICLMLLV